MEKGTTYAMLKKRGRKEEYLTKGCRKMRLKLVTAIVLLMAMFLGVSAVSATYVDLAITNMEVSPTATPQGQPIYIEVTVENQGTEDRSVHLVVYAEQEGTGKNYSIGEHDFWLPIGHSQVRYNVWDTTGVDCGTYWVTAWIIEPADIDQNDNIARKKVGGICVPYQEPKMNLLTPIGSTILMLVALGISTIGFFKLLMSPRLRWPWRFSKKSTSRNSHPC